MSHLIVMGLFMAAQPIAEAPQAPIAAGPIESIFEVLKVAKSCHVDELRIALYPSDKDELRLFLTQDPQDVPVKCLNGWLTLNGRRLHLKARWWNDDFTKDRP